MFTRNRQSHTSCVDGGGVRNTGWLRQPQTRPTASRLARRVNSVARSAAAGAAAVTVVVSLGLTGCGSATAGQPPRSDAAPAPATGTTQSAAPAAAVTPGFSTPQDAVDGAYQAALAGNWGAACSYLDPADQSLCLSGLSALGGTLPAATGSFTIGRAVVQGSEALVSVTGNLCVPSTPCAANTDPSLGMPASPAQFQSSYQAAVASSNSSNSSLPANLSPVPCTQIGGMWYLY
jgi:hypothetical protein